MYPLYIEEAEQRLLVTTILVLTTAMAASLLGRANTFLDWEGKLHRFISFVCAKL